MAEPRLLGRQRERARCDALLDGALTGDGGAVWLEGEAGIGKTRLLEAARAAADGRFRILATTGYESEVDVPWAGLVALVDPLLRAEALDALPAPQRRALDVALRRVVDDDPVEPFAVVLAVRQLVLDAADGQPVLVLVDDAHWLDESTRLAVDHLARHAGGAPLAVIVASRPSERATPVAPVELGPMADEDADELLREAGVDSGAARARLVAELGGRPMLLLVMASRLDPSATDDGSGVPLGLPASLLELAAERLRTVHPALLRPLLVVATVLGGDRATVSRALAHEGFSLADLDAAEAEGLVAIEADRIVFSHPTLRSAVYHGASASERRHVHRTVGASVDRPEVQALHLGLGADGPDPELAERAAAAADGLAARGAPVEAARARELAARLTEDPQAAARHLRLAAELLVDSPETIAALALLDRADLVQRPLVEQARAERVRLRLAARSAADDTPIDRLQALASSVVDEDPALAASLLLEALPPLIRQLRALDVVAVAQQAREVAQRSDDAGIRRRADIALGGALVAMGDPEGGPLLEGYRALLAEEGAASAAPFLAEVAAPVLGFLHRSADARDLLQELEADLRRRVALPVLTTVLSAKASLAHGPDLRTTISAAEEALGYAEELNQPGLMALPAQSLAVAAAMRGDVDALGRALGVLGQLGSAVNLMTAGVARGALALGQGRLDDAIAEYEALAHDVGVGQGLLRWEPEWAECLVRSQRRDEARKVVTDLEAAGGPGWALAGMARIEGMLAEDTEQAAELFQLSIDLMVGAANAVGEGRTELAWGERLRRARSRATARGHLERAVELLDGSGAEIWADRARQELALAGGASASGTGGEGLTAQELQVARLAASGATNRDIGHELFVSPRTVEAHLSAIYRKLGVRNRRELAARAVEDERLRA